MSAKEPEPKVRGTELRSREELLRLRDEDPDHIEVYDVEYDEVERVLPMSEVRVRCQQTIDGAKALRASHPDPEVERLLKEGSAELLSFSKTHPQYFSKLVDRNTPARVIDNMFMMIDVRARIESGELDEDMALSAMQERLLRECMK